MSGRHARRRGYMLVEVLTALGLLTIFALAASRVFHSTMQLMRDVPAAHERQIRFDSVTSALREDVWRASAIEPAEQGVRLQLDGQQVHWSIDGDVITRASAQSQQRWEIGDAVQSIAPRQARLVVALRGGDELHLPRVPVRMEEASP
jgi:type II secretory pathway component PulJ